MDEFLQSGLKTIIVITIADLLDETYIGSLIGHEFINRLPAGVDKCGENGEYHTFCFDGSIFKNPVRYTLGIPLKVFHVVNMGDGTRQTYHY